MDKDKNEHKTTDLALAAYINITMPIIRLEWLDRRASFVFPKSKLTEKLITGYKNRQAKVEPLEYFNSIKNLKGRLYNDGIN